MSVNQMTPTDHKRYEWEQLEDSNIDWERIRELKRDAKEVRNEMWKQEYYWDGKTCKEIGDYYGYDESTVYRVVSTGEPLEEE